MVKSILQQRIIRINPKQYVIHSQTPKKELSYVVSYDEIGKPWECQCFNWISEKSLTGEDCKHIKLVKPFIIDKLQGKILQVLDDNNITNDISDETFLIRLIWDSYGIETISQVIIGLLNEKLPSIISIQNTLKWLRSTDQLLLDYVQITIPTEPIKLEDDGTHTIKVYKYVD